WAGGQLPLQLQAEGLTPAEIEASARIETEVADRLPVRWREALARPIRLEWTDALPARVHGRTTASRIRLDRRLLHDWKAQPPGDDPQLSSVRAAVAALVHELAHVLDRSEGRALSRDPRLLNLAGWQVRPWHLA